MGYAYDSLLCKKITGYLQINGEQRANNLRRNIEKMYAGPKPARPRIFKNLVILRNWGLINKRREYSSGGLEKTFYSLTEIGLICTKYDYEPEDYNKFYNVCYLISEIALFGGKEEKERTGNAQAGDLGYHDPVTNKYKILYFEKKEGVSVKEILRRNNDSMNLSKEEVEEYLNFLQSKGIIGPIYDAFGEKRYQILNDDFKEFIDDIWSHLSGPIHMSITLKWYYIKRPSLIEKEWMIRFRGKKATEDFIKRYDSIRKNIKEKSPHLRVNPIHNTNEINKKIIEGYKMISQKYPKDKDFGNLKGFKETILSLVCPSEILSEIEQIK
jgi:DNA-binding PadR family transcriptional regulator